ncbi:hypothetical protein [Methylacidimicrobium sp. B4]|uniref:hypothetical protein n=1 Tax=Methylacidimicrobium sp. B4 TaxID=2796139 RepID=UPI001A8E23A1|nr:hypothetical protein [Methylacidimicrobium sp. B4]QSR84943.1 hypothetical protein MacB4_01320 [Methylacidimicrobium sp. B4]
MGGGHGRSEARGAPLRQARRGAHGLRAAPPPLLLFLLSLLLLDCRSGSSSPEGQYGGSWTEADQSTVRVTLSLAPGGKAVMQRIVRWPDGQTEADSWESEYRVGGDRILIGSEGKVYAVFQRQGHALLDPSHLVNGKPIRLERQAAKAP